MKNPLSKTKAKPQPTHQPEEYRHCRAWNEAIGLPSYVIRRELRLLSEEDAPVDTVFQRPDGSWFLFKDITDQHMINEMTAIFTAQNWGQP